MNRELFAEITTGDLAFMGSAALAGFVLALVTRLIASRIKGRLRRFDKANIGAQLLDDMDDALAIWVVVAGVYLGLLATICLRCDRALPSSASWWWFTLA